MTEPHDTIETELQSMTQYEGEPTELWKRAAEQVEAEGADGTDGGKASRHRHWRFMNRSIAPRHLVTGLATAAVLVLVVSVALPNLGKARSAARRTEMAMSPSLEEEATVTTSWDTTSGSTSASASKNYGKAYNESSGLIPGRDFQFDIDGDGKPLYIIGQTPVSGSLIRGAYEGRSRNTLRQSEAQEAATRSVIRNVTIEIRTPDVAAVFLKARQLVSEAGGEFIEDSSLTGEDDEARANLTLRVSPSRLSEVLNELRKLGVVASEQARSEDVTDQVVDLEARLRNEQRVEEELLELLETRADANLSEILKLQSEIGRVRTNIERFIAQRDRIARLVSLAKVLVIIRPEIVEPVIVKPKDASMWDYFKTSINDSWEGGVAFLSNTVAGLLGILVGGLVWWVALIAVALMVRRYIRTLPEPAP